MILRDSLAELEELLAAHSGVAEQLRPAAPPDAVPLLSDRVGVEPPPSLMDLYGWHDGSAPASQHQRPLCLFPRFWQFMFLEWVESEMQFPLEWCRKIGVSGLPFAKHETGDYFVAESGDDGFIWRASYDGVTPAGPDGTMVGLVDDTCRALRGEHPEFAAVFDDTGMDWVFPGEESEV